MAPTAPASSEGCSLCAAPTNTWNPTSFWRVFNLPTTVTADEDGLLLEVLVIPPTCTSSPPSALGPAAAPNIRGVTTSNVSVTVELRLTWHVPSTILPTFSP